MIAQANGSDPLAIWISFFSLLVSVAGFYFTYFRTKDALHVTTAWPEFVSERLEPDHGTIETWKLSIYFVNRGNLPAAFIGMRVAARLYDRYDQFMTAVNSTSDILPAFILAAGEMRHESIEITFNGTTVRDQMRATGMKECAVEFRIGTVRSSDGRKRTGTAPLCSIVVRLAGRDITLHLEASKKSHAVR